MSINQYIMNSLLEKQIIGKRRPRSFERKKTAYRPAGIISIFKDNQGFVGKMRQEPARNHSVKQRSQKKRLPPLAVSASTAFFLVTGIIFIIYSQGMSMDWIGRQVVNSEAEQNSQNSLARYVGVTIEPSALQDPELVNEEVSIELASATIPGNNIPENSIPLDLTETFAWQTYTVRRGDSVSRIAANFSVSMDAIIASNGITNARSIREGEVLRIPNMDGIPYTVRQGDSLSGISQSMGVPLEAILDANDIQSDIIQAGVTLFVPGARMNRDDLRLALGELFVYPVRGARLSSPFGWRNDPFTGVRRHHAAIDLSISQGTPIVAAMDGRVAAIGYDRTYGNFLIISHSGGFQTMYAHMHSVQVRNGDQVTQGARIGTVGNTGYSTGPHLHFAVFRNGRAVNPLDFLSPNR